MQLPRLIFDLQPLFPCHKPDDHQSSETPDNVRFSRKRSDPHTESICETCYHGISRYNNSVYTIPDPPERGSKLFSMSAKTVFQCIARMVVAMGG